MESVDTRAFAFTCRHCNESMKMQGGWWHFGLKVLLTLAGLAAFGAGLVSFFYYPSKLALHTHVSENALLVGQAENTFTKPSGEFTLSLCKEYSEFLTQLCENSTLHSEEQQSRAMAEWIADKLDSFQLGVTAIQKFPVGANDTGYNTYAILRSPRGDGTESLVISTRSIPCKNRVADAITGTGVLLGMIKHLSTRPWRHKEFVVVFTDGRHGYKGAEAWLGEYHSPAPPSNDAFEEQGHYRKFKRAGQIMGALNVDLNHQLFDKILILPEGTNGQLPNMDLFTMTVQYVRRTGMKPHLSKAYVENFVPKTLLSYLKEEMVILFNSMLTLAVGVPTGDHGIFTKYYIDAVTIQPIPGHSHNAYMPMSQISQLIEMVMRSLNAITERLHQSYYYYLFVGLENFVPIGYYTPTLGLLLLPILFKGVYLYYYVDGDRRYFNSFANYFAICGMSIVIMLLPFFLENFVVSPRSLVQVWLGVSACIVFALFSIILPFVDKTMSKKAIAASPNKSGAKKDGKKQEETATVDKEEERDWTSLLAISYSGLVLFLGPFCILNFSFCVALSVLMVPVTCMIWRTSSHMLNSIQSVLVVMFSPIGLVLLFSIYQGLDFFDCWVTLLSHFEEFSTLTYPFLCLAILPQTLTWLYILNHNFA